MTNVLNFRPKLKGTFLEQTHTVTYIKGGPYSLIVKGTYNDSMFTFKSKKEFDIPLKIKPSLHIHSLNKNAYIVVVSNILKWFKAGNNLLDPSDTRNKPAIDANIENSFSIKTGKGLIIK
jgi:hypothetical protein